MDTWNPVKELKDLTANYYELHTELVVESGEGIERRRNCWLSPAPWRESWNPVKELKGEIQVRDRQHRRKWNPVKELKELDTIKLELSGDECGIR